MSCCMTWGVSPPTREVPPHVTLHDMGGVPPCHAGVSSAPARLCFQKMKSPEPAFHSHQDFCFKRDSCFQKTKPPEATFHSHQGILEPKKLVSWHARSCSWHVRSLCSWNVRTLKNPQPESCHFGEKKMVSGHETDISEDLPAK